MAGQIINRGKNTWQVKVPMGRDPNTGTRKYHTHTIHGRKEDAQKYLTAVLRERDLGTFVEPTAQTLDRYLDSWLANVAKHQIREITHRDYVGKLKLYVRPLLGAKLIHQVTPMDIRTVYAAMLDKGLSRQTVRCTHAILSSAFKHAVVDRLIAFAPTSNVKPPKRVRPETEVLDAEQARRLLAAAESDRLGIVFKLAIMSGLRPGEYLALRWENMDLTAGKVTVRHSLVYSKGGGWSLTEPKTPRSRRTVPLPAGLVRELREHKRQQAEERLAAGASYTNHGFVFASANGGPLNIQNVTQRHFKPILKAAGLPHFRLYDLRHTCATLLLLGDVNPKVVAERLGHASVMLTLDTYSHVLPTMQTAATETLGTMLYGEAQ